MDYFTNPDHTQAYSLGFSQILSGNKESFYVLSGELSNTEMSVKYYGSSAPWYRHGWRGWEQGYSNNGQIFGASIGPGSNSQYLDFSYYYPGGKIGGYIQRVRFDNDYFFNVLSSDTNGSQAELSLGIDSLLHLASIELYGKLEFDYFLNRLYILPNNDFNFHAEIGAKYLF